MLGLRHANLSPYPPSFDAAMMMPVPPTTNIATTYAGSNSPQGPPIGDCQFGDDGRFLCFANERPSFTPVPAFFYVRCDDIPEPEPTSKNCNCYIALGVDVTVVLDSKNFCGCAVLPQDDITDGIYNVAWDCREILQGTCVGQDAFGTCLSSSDPNAPFLSGFDAGGRLVDCWLNAAGTWSCLFEEQPVSFVPAEESVMLVACDAFPEDGPNEDCNCLISLTSYEDIDVEELCRYCYILPQDDGTWDVAWDCSNKLNGTCVGRDFTGNCISNVEEAPSSAIEAATPPPGPPIGDCQFGDDGRFLCFANERPSFTPVPAFFYVRCDDIPEPEPTSKNCNCYIVLGDTAEEILDPDNYCDCAVLPQDDITDGIYNVAWDCREILQGICVGQDAFGTCLSSSDPDAPFLSGFDAGGRLVDCWLNAAGTWSCLFEEQPVSFVPAEESVMLVACDAFPEDGPNEDCRCLISLTSYEDFDVEELCRYCYILPQDDGTWDVAWDCSNKLNGTCVGRDFTGDCISTVDASSTSAKSFPSTRTTPSLSSSLLATYAYDEHP